MFTEKQEKVLKLATHRWNILYGATRSGKTHISYFLALIRIKQHWNDPILFAGKTLNTLDRNVFDPMRKIFGEDHIGDIVKNREITIFGKVCYCVGANDDRAITKIQGTGLGYAYLDELTTYPENFFQMLKSRLDKPNACCDATCNPESPSHFVKQFIDKAKNDDGIDLYEEQFTLYDNTFLSKDFISSLEAEYRGTIYFDKWVLGKWVKAEGLVFPLFKREKHFLTPEQFTETYGTHYIRYVIYGVDGANTNDSTAIVPVAIMDNGQAVVLKMFYHNPKINGQLSNEQLMPHIIRYLEEMDREYGFSRFGVQYAMPYDCAAADLGLTLSYHLPDRYNVQKYTMKDIMLTTDIVNNAFSRDAVAILDYGSTRNYVRGTEMQGHQLVTDLELMVWDKNNEKYDSSVPNDCADAFRYALCTYYINQENLWETPDTNRRYIK